VLEAERHSGACEAAVWQGDSIVQQFDSSAKVVGVVRQVTTAMF
jgi:hypothetical protein